MNNKILTLLLSILILTGLAFATVPYLNSVSPTDTTKERGKLNIDISKIQEGSDK